MPLAGFSEVTTEVTVVTIIQVLKVEFGVQKYMKKRSRVKAMGYCRAEVTSFVLTVSHLNLDLSSFCRIM